MPTSATPPIILILLQLALLLSATYAQPHPRNRTACPAVSTCLNNIQSGLKCSPVIPVPARALTRPVSPGTFSLTPLRKGVWLFTNSNGYLSLLLRSGNRLALLDAPDSFAPLPPDGTPLLAQAAQEVLNGTIPSRVDLVYSHAHFDHIGDAAHFIAFIRNKYPRARRFVWGTREARQLIEDSFSNRGVLPNVIIGNKGRTLTVGPGLHIQMTIIGGHTNEDVLLYIPRHRREKAIAMAVDLVFPRWSPPFNFAITNNVGAYVRAHKELLKLNFDVYVGGHIRIGDKKDVRENLLFTEDVIAAAQTALGSVTGQDLFEAGLGKVADPSAPEFGNYWFALIDVQRKVEIDKCYRIVLEKWGCRLAAVDVTARGHCFAALHEYLAVQF